MKGILLCGGHGTRLQPATFAINKHLIPIINRPMIEYPIRTLKNLGIEDILIVSGGEHIGMFAEYLGDGSDFGVNFTYKVQKEATGIAAALLLAKDFTKGEKMAVILGDNFFADQITISQIQSPTIFLKSVKNPKRFGVYDEESNSIIEKPEKPKTDLAVTGLYIYDSEVFDFIKTLSPSARGELEITSVNNWYLSRNKMEVIKLQRFWSDMGTPESMIETIRYISMCEKIAKRALGRTAWNKNKAWSIEVKDKIKQANLGRKYPNTINNKKGRKKEENANWKGGISTEEKLIRESREYEEWRKSVFERDNYTCVLGGRDHGNKLNADHIKPFSLYPKLRFEISNGQTLCEECHKKTDTYGSKSRKTFINKSKNYDKSIKIK